MKMIKFAVLATTFLLTQNVYASPKFAEFPAKVYKGKHKAAKLTEDTSSFRTRFNNLVQDDVNFAGHYVLSYVGCGTSCIYGLLYDARSGKTSFLPSGSLTGCYTEDGFTDSEIYYNKNSRLLVMAGVFDEQSSCQTRYYLEKNGKLKLLKTTAFK